MDIPRAKETYFTKDLGIAAYLYATKKVELISIERVPRSRVCYFHFSPEKTAFNLATDYINEVAEVIQPRQLFHAIKYVKDALYSNA